MTSNATLYKTLSNPTNLKESDEVQDYLSNFQFVVALVTHFVFSYCAESSMGPLAMKARST